jgi:hypothetical protein
MTRAFVLGNGTSRRNISIPDLHQLGRIYGCNALYREFVPDVLVATDQPIATAIQDSGYAQTNEFYTRRPTAGTGARALPEAYRGYSSGPNALGLAARQGNLQIYLLGFDMGPTENNLFNNVYADTEFYKTSAHPPTFVGNWVRQVIHVFRDYPQVQFIRVYGATTARIAELDLVPNLEHIDLATFLDRMNNWPDNH